MQCISCGESYERPPTDYNSVRCLMCRRERKRKSQRDRQRELRGGEKADRDEADPSRSCWSCRHLDPDTLTCEPGELAGHFPPAGPGQWACDCAEYSQARLKGVRA